MRSSRHGRESGQGLGGSGGQPPAAAKAQPRKAPAWWRRLSLAVGSVLLILGTTEGVLRLMDAGYPAAFFVSRDADTVETNDRFAWRFMPRILARDPLAFRMAHRKPANTTRIFILGESAAQGFPDAAFGFGRVLDLLLRSRHPDRRFEIVNTAMTAVNSHAVREIARECLNYEPDLFILYCGNNEVVGPFGPGTVFQSTLPPLWLIRLRLAASKLRLAQELGGVMEGWLRRTDSAGSWSGMESFMDRRVASDDPRLERVYAYFRANVEDILRGVGRRGVPAVVCTAPVNLEACAPFASEHRRGLTEGELGKWRAAYALGTNAEARADWAAAVEHYAAATAADPLFAEVDYRRGRCLAALGRPTESRAAFAEARDHDALRFRADSRLNALLRELARSGGPRVTLYDAERDLTGRDAEFFYEHVHLKFAGNYRLARGILPLVESALSLETVGHTEAPILTEEACASRLAYTLWSRWKSEDRIMKLLYRPPFTLQFDRPTEFPGKVARHRQLAAEALSVEEMKRSVAAYALALKEQPAGLGLRENLADLLSDSGDSAAAIRVAQDLLAERPAGVRARLRVGDLLLLAGRYDEALVLFRDVLRVRPELPEVHISLVGALVGLGRNEEAVAAYDAAVRRGCESAALHSNVAVALLNRGDLEGGEQHLRRALQWMDQPSWRANLGAVLFKRGKYREALSEFREAVAALPNNAALHYNVARALLATGDTNGAVAALSEALRVDPGYEKARRDLDAISRNVLGTAVPGGP